MNSEVEQGPGLQTTNQNIKAIVYGRGSTSHNRQRNIFNGSINDFLDLYGQEVHIENEKDRHLFWGVGIALVGTTLLYAIYELWKNNIITNPGAALYTGIVVGVVALGLLFYHIYRYNNFNNSDIIKRARKELKARGKNAGDVARNAAEGETEAKTVEIRADTDMQNISNIAKVHRTKEIATGVCIETTGDVMDSVKKTSDKVADATNSIQAANVPQMQHGLQSLSTLSNTAKSLFD